MATTAQRESHVADAPRWCTDLIDVDVGVQVNVGVNTDSKGKSKCVDVGRRRCCCRGWLEASVQVEVVGRRQCRRRC